MNDRQIIDRAVSFTWRKRRIVTGIRYWLLGKASRLFPSVRDSSIFDDLRTFCCFVGHGRSGGTLVGALLNAHPNIVMSNELNALRHLRNGLTAEQLFRVIYLVSQRQVRRGSRGGGGYTYAVADQWQGKHDRLLVIGDRKAGATAFELVKDSRLLEILDKKVALDRRFVHVIRNPFDTIATTYHKTDPKAGEDASMHLQREIRNYFARCSAVSQIEERYGRQSVCNIFHEALIASPKQELARLCEFLAVDAPDSYLESCASIIMANANQSRRTIDWSDHEMSMVREGMASYHWLKNYGFDD